MIPIKAIHVRVYGESEDGGGHVAGIRHSTLFKLRCTHKFLKDCNTE